MSDEKSNQSEQSSQSAATPNAAPQTVATSPMQTNNPPPPKEDPFALDPGLIGEVQKGERPPKHTTIQRPEIVRKAPLEKKQS
jgi:hypothetical protein